jgi:hypothetical protein
VAGRDQPDRGPPHAERRHLRGDPNLDARRSADHGRHRHDVAREALGDRAGDLRTRAGGPGLERSVRGRGVSRALGRGGGQGVAHVQHQGDLEDAEEQRHQYDHHQDEVDDRRTCLVTGAGG